jgi:dihydrolipoamide dehydrogenase
MVVGEIVEERDLVIVGGGPGGYHAAIRAAQLGLSVTIIEKESFGGACLNKGCIPSKIFATSARKMDEIKQAHKFGLRVENLEFDLSFLQEQKEIKINQLKQGIEALLKTNEVERVKGSAYFLAEDRVGVEDEHTFTVYRFKQAIVATGSRYTFPSNIVPDHMRIFDLLSIYSIKEVPNKLVVYGDDYISLEVATSFRLLGSDVTLILPNKRKDFSFDSSVNKELKRQLKKMKIKVVLGDSIAGVDRDGDSLQIQLGSEEQVEVTHLYLSAKSIPNITELGLERLGIEKTKDGYLKIDSSGKTSISTIYAVGDVTEGPSLAIKAIKQGKIAAEAIAGLPVEVDLTFIPTVIQMKPPIAFVGLTEEQARVHYDNVNVAEFPLGGNGYASLLGERDGFVKVISEASSDLILGVQLMGYGAVELISSSVIALEMVARTEDMEFAHYPHPSINESLLEAIEALSGKAVHLSPGKQKNPDSEISHSTTEKRSSFKWQS